VNCGIQIEIEYLEKSDIPAPFVRRCNRTGAAGKAYARS
jgi:hypothetical protein